MNPVTAKRRMAHRNASEKNQVRISEEALRRLCLCKTERAFHCPETFLFKKMLENANQGKGVSFRNVLLDAKHFLIVLTSFFEGNIFA